MSDTGTDTPTDTTPSGTGAAKHATVSVNLDPTAIEELLAKQPTASEEEKSKAKTSTVTHQLSIDVSGMTWGEVQSSLGSSDFLSDAKVSLTPADAKTPLEADLHADLLKQHWSQIGGLDLTTTLGGDVNYTDHKGAGAMLDLKQDIKFKNATIEGTITTDFSGGTPKVTGQVGLKFDF